MIKAVILFENQMRISLKLKLAGVLALAAVLSSCLVTSKYESPPSQNELERLDPTGVVRLYWASAVIGDSDTIRQIVGRPGESMLWECKPKQVQSNSKGTSHEYLGESLASPGLDEQGEPGASIDNLDSILSRARIIRIAGKQLDTHFDRAENKSFGREAMLLYRPKDSPNRYNSTVFFLLYDDHRWRIVDITDEDYFLKFVGNKKFGEERECPPAE